MARRRHRHRGHHHRHRAHHHHRRQRQRRRHYHHHFRRRAAGGNGQNSDVKLTWRHFGILLAFSSVIMFLMGIFLIAMVGGGAFKIGIILLCGGGVVFFAGVTCLVCSPKTQTETDQELTQVSLLLIKMNSTFLYRFESVYYFQTPQQLATPSPSTHPYPHPTMLQNFYGILAFSFFTDLKGFLRDFQ